MMTRRSFLGGALAFAAMRPWRGFARGFQADSRALLRFGAISDLHVRGKEGQFGLEHLVKALRWYRQMDVDGVVVAGDMADNGLVAELQLVAGAWNEVFPGGTGRNGKKVEKLFVYGNHDIEGAKYNPKLKPSAEEIISTDRAAAWEKVFGEPYEPVWEKKINGFVFIGAHWVDWSGVREIEKYFENRAADLGGDRPFFYIQHPHPLNTCHGPWAWGHDEGYATRALSRFPNAVALSGHSHHSLTDEKAIWQGAFTSIGTASLRYVAPMFGRENAGPSQLADLRQMPEVDKFSEKQGLLFSVYTDRMVVERRDFVDDGALGAPWIVPLATTERPYDFAVRSRCGKAPRFAPDAKVSVAGPLDGKDRKGRATRQIVVSFPSALQGEGLTRAFDYEVAAELAECDVVRIAKAKRVHSPGFFRKPECESSEVKCVFSLDEIATRRASYLVPRLRFAVRAADSFGNMGEPIYSEQIKL